MKKIKSLLLVVVAASFALLALSCTKEDAAMKKLSGSWYMSELNLEISSSIIPNGTSSYTLRYSKEDTKAVISLGADGTLTAQVKEDGTETESVIAKWSADGNVITITSEDETVSVPYSFSGDRLYIDVAKVMNDNWIDEDMASMGMKVDKAQLIFDRY